MTDPDLLTLYRHATALYRHLHDAVQSRGLTSSSAPRPIRAPEQSTQEPSEPAPT